MLARLRGLFESVSLRARLGLSFFALAVGFWTLAATARASKSAAVHTPPVKVEHRGTPDRVVLVFIDSLSRDIATDAARMPVLNRLAAEGASFEVQPCRDQLTYLCLRAVLTGRDDSSLLSISDNFRPSHEGPPETLLSAVAARPGRVAVVGSPDFHPYRRSLFIEHELGKHDETPERLLREYQALASANADLVIVSLTSGDMTAHAHGVGSPQYDEAFQRLDAAVGALSRALSPETTLVVFGDHGHDKQGRHLPGTASKTWALYHGPAFRPGFSAALRITDHRALLGLVLGVPTEAIYHGPPLAALLEPAWVERALGGKLPPLQAPASEASSGLGGRVLTLFSVMLASLGAVWLATRQQRRRGVLLALGAATIVLAMLVGLGFDQIRTLVHDHGGDAWRGLCLLVPLALGCGAAWLLVRTAPFSDGAGPWLPTAAAATTLVTLLLMLPTAYYYGSRRAIVLAGAVALGFMLIDVWRRSAPAGSRLLPTLCLVLAAAVSISLYSVRQLGPETGGASSWALDAPVYTRAARHTLLLAKLLLGALLLAPRVRSHRLDAVSAGALLTSSLVLEVAGLRLPHAVYGAVFAALVLGWVLGGASVRRSATCFSAALLLLDHLYNGDVARLAPIVTILAAAGALLFAWRRVGLSERGVRWAEGLTVAVGIYLMFWPSVGFHLVGIDFSFMFQWVREENYEKQWYLIGLGVIVKLALPLALVAALSAQRASDGVAQRVALGALVAKVAALSIMIASYALWHDLTSQIALAMLAELALLMFGVCAAAVALPLERRMWAAGSSDLMSSSASMATPK
jgi:hypothetical protein